MEISSILLAIVAVIIGIYYFTTKGFDYFENINLPYAKPVPLLGSMWQTFIRRKPIAELIENIYNIDKEAKYVGAFDFMTPVLMIRDIELIKSITVKNFDHFPDHRGFSDEIHDPLFGKNLFALRGDRWRDVRTILSPAFTSSKMKGMFHLMSECADNLCNFLNDLPEDQRELDIKDIFTRYTNDIIATCAFGLNVDSLKNRNNKFYLYGRQGTQFNTSAFLKVAIMRSFPKLAKLLDLQIIEKEIAEFFKDLIATTIRTRDQKGIVRPDMIQLMMETRNHDDPSKSLTIEDMTAQAFVFFFGGFESTSTLMCFAAHEIAANPDIHERLQEEIDRVIAENNGRVTYDAVNSMEYLGAILDEALRLYPVNAILDRACIKSFELPPAKPGLKPIIVKPGENIWIPVYGIQHDEQYYEEPKKFNPDRFMKGNVKTTNSGTHLAFGIGPRMCIGNRFALMETKVLLFHILARFNLKPCSKTVIPMELTHNGFNMTSRNGFWLSFEPRSTQQVLLATSTSDSAGMD